MGTWLLYKEYLHWNIDPVMLNFGSLQIRWYGVCFALGFLLGQWAMTKIYRNEQRDVKQVDSLFVWVIVSTVIGARLGHCLFYEPTYYLANPLEILKVWRGGLASHGATVGIIVAMIGFCMKFKVSFLWLLSRLGIAVCLAISFIRLGNFFNSEILGLPSTLPWAIVFEAVDQIPRHPSQLYEALTYLILFLFLFKLYFKKGAQISSSFLFGTFLCLLFGARFLLEFTKERQSELISSMALNMGQLLSVPFILVGLGLIIYSYNSNKGSKQH